MKLSVADLQARISTSPFSVWLGLRVVSIGSELVEFGLPWREEFMGTMRLNRTHGGIIAALVDAAGGYTLMANTGRTLSTVDLRVDFHRSGGNVGKRIEGLIVYMGRKLACVDVRIFDADAVL